jgi:hypothetical protein
MNLPSATDLWRRLGGSGSRPTPTPGAEPGESEEDRRVWARHSSALEARVQSTRPGLTGAVPARVRDISRGGASLEVARPFDPGELVSVELPGPDGGSFALACVVHVTEAGEGWFLLGCTFAQELSDGDLAAFGARRRRSTGPDQRGWERFRCSAAARCQLLSGDAAPAWPARVHNISASGVGLVADRQLETGTLLNVTVQRPDGRSPTLLACVVQVTPREDGEWALGCNFLRELAEADLLALQ